MAIHAERLVEDAYALLVGVDGNQRSKDTQKLCVVKGR